MADKLELSSQDARIAVSREVGGIDMGVLEDGTAYLSGRGLAALCGVAPASIIQQNIDWKAGKRTSRLAKLLLEQGFNGDALAIDTKVKGSPVTAYPEKVAMAVLEYFSFEAQGDFSVAVSNYRKMARAGLRAFVYTALGYEVGLSPKWKEFHDRLNMHAVPRGYFSVFREMSDLVIASIRAGLRVNEHTIPDISCGIAWAKRWSEFDFDTKFGAKKKYEHNYPDYFPQAVSNPQAMNIYPIDALGEFRRWILDVYLVEKFPGYLAGKVKAGELPPSTAELLLEAVLPITATVPKFPAPKKPPFST